MNSILRFFQHVVIVHELVHVVLFTFSSTPTPVKYHGTHGVPNNNPLSIDRGGDSGPSLEAVMIGGEVALATQAGRGINYVNPEEICAVVRGGDSTGWKVLSRMCISNAVQLTRRFTIHYSQHAQSDGHCYR
jgi:hypothetical protein